MLKGYSKVYTRLCIVSRVGCEQREEILKTEMGALQARLQDANGNINSRDNMLVQGLL